jgi:hypothetical protein
VEVLAFAGGLALVIVSLGLFICLVAHAASLASVESYRNTTRVPSDPPMWTYSKTTTTTTPATEAEPSSETDT